MVSRLATVLVSRLMLATAMVCRQQCAMLRLTLTVTNLIRPWCLITVTMLCRRPLRQPVGPIDSASLLIGVLLETITSMCCVLGWWARW